MRELRHYCETASYEELLDVLRVLDEALVPRCESYSGYARAGVQGIRWALSKSHGAPVRLRSDAGPIIRL